MDREQQLRYYWVSSLYNDIDRLIIDISDYKTIELGMDVKYTLLAIKHLQWASSNLLKAEKGVKDNADKP